MATNAQNAKKLFIQTVKNMANNDWKDVTAANLAKAKGARMN